MPNLVLILVSKKTNRLFEKWSRNFTGGPVVKTSPSNAGSAGSTLGHKAKVPCLEAKKPNHKTEVIL